MATKTPAKTAAAAKPAKAKKPVSKPAAAKKAAPKKAAPKKTASKTIAKTPAKTAPSTTTTPKPAPKPAQKSVASPAAVKPKPATSIEGPFGDVDLSKKELIERVLTATGMKPRDVRPIIEATLNELGKAIDRGETLRINPLGVVHIKRAKQTSTGRVVVTKIKRKKPDPDPKSPLAKAAE